MKQFYVGNLLDRRRNRVFLCLFLFTSLVLKAQNYPEPVNLNDVSTEQYTPPSFTPEYLEPYELDNGHMLTKISAADVFNTTGQQLNNNYSSDQAWNSDGTLLKLKGYPAAILDGETYEFLYWSSIPGYGRWSNLQPNVVFGVSGNKFVAHDVPSNQRTTLRTFSNYSQVDFGYGQGNQSDDDKYVVLIGLSSGVRDLIVYDIQNDVIESTYNIGTAGDLDWASISPLGNYVVVSWRDDGSGEREGYKVFNRDFSNQRHLSNYTQHGDLGIDANGDEVVVSFGNEVIRANDYYLEMLRLNDGLMTPLFYWDRDLPNHNGYSGVWGGHISMRNVQRPGWAYISEECCSSHPTLPREIFAIKLDGSNVIERYGNSHADVVNYNHEVKASVNRDGTKIVFTSNWHDSTMSNYDAAPAWVVEVPQTSLSTNEPEEIVDSKIKIYPNPSTGIVNIKSDNINIESIQVFDMLGRQLQTNNLNATNGQINLSRYPSGMYLLKLNTANNSTTKQIMLQ